jgi:tetratricopeptide (TPR) repeat protein
MTLLNQRAENLRRFEIPVAVFLILVGVARVALTLWNSVKTNGAAGFPLDDPWIHLQFAKNLHAFGSFSYFANEQVTAGSTSPLYTFLLSAGFFVTSNEMILSYALGTFFYAVAGFMFYRLLRVMVPDRWWIPLIGVLVFVLEPRMQWAAQSGMETTLFIAGIITCFWAFASRQWRMLGVLLGLLLWVRPEAVILMAIVGVGGAFELLSGAASAGRDERVPRMSFRQLWLIVRVPLALTGLISLLYVLLNLYLSGTLLPNTFAAKLTYYGGKGIDFPEHAFTFLTAKHMVVIALFSAVGAIVAIVDAVKYRRVSGLMHVVWVLAMVAVYWAKLPFLFQQGRYLMPVIPSLLVLGIMGASALTGYLGRKFFHQFPRSADALFSGAVLGIVILQFGLMDVTMAAEYIDMCRYILDRQVRTARWLSENLPQDAVVATHDIGAIGYYSGRRVVDMVGLVTPAAIKTLGNLDSLETLLVRRGVTHLAVLRSWFEITNIPPLFRTNENYPEVMEVFPFDRSRAHFVSSQASLTFNSAIQYLAQGRLSIAGPMLEQVVAMDTLYSRGFFALGIALRSAGRRKEAEESLTKAVRLSPDLWQAQTALAELEAGDGKTRDAINRLEKNLQPRPECAIAFKLLSDLYAREGKDTAAVHRYGEIYKRLSEAGNNP